MQNNSANNSKIGKHSKTVGIQGKTSGRRQWREASKQSTNGKSGIRQEKTTGILEREVMVEDDSPGKNCSERFS
jgi:hypothetical protein